MDPSIPVELIRTPYFNRCLNKIDMDLKLFYQESQEDAPSPASSSLSLLPRERAEKKHWCEECGKGFTRLGIINTDSFVNFLDAPEGLMNHTGEIFQYPVSPSPPPLGGPNRLSEAPERLSETRDRLLEVPERLRSPRQSL